METISKKTQTNEEILLHLIQDTFYFRSLPKLLIFLDSWLEKVLTHKEKNKHLKTSDLKFFTATFSKLLTACNELNHVFSENQLYFMEANKIPRSYIQKEQEWLRFYPNHLTKREICDPTSVFRSIFKNHDLDFYVHTLENGMKRDAPVFPCYSNLKRMIEACWLIHERSISKNSYQSVSKTPNNLSFSLSCPLLIDEIHLSNPYLVVESFFSFVGLEEYREDLKRWFKAALNEHESYEDANDLLFIHNQLIQLIEAGYLIGMSKLDYIPTPHYTTQHATFGHWLLARIENQYHIQALSPHFRENPLAYCSTQLTLDNIVKLRYGLKEWLEAALSKNSSITSLDHPYIFDQFEELQKIIEALFLIVIQPALNDSSTL